MKKIISAECLKMRYGTGMKLCLFFVIALSAINAGLHMSRDEYGTMYFMSEIFGLVISALFAGLFLSREYGNKTLYHTLHTGCSRTQIYFAKYISYMVSCFCFLALNMEVLFLTVMFLGKLGGEVSVVTVLVYVLAGIGYDMCLAGVFFFMGMMIKDSGITVTAGIIISAWMVASSEILWTDRTYPLALERYEILQAIPVMNLSLTFAVTMLVVVVGSFLFRRKEL